MIRPTSRGQRAGITLTEILISILIMGVGMLSLATLFPLGLQRLREAARSSRSAHLVQTAAKEIASRDLLFKQSFRVNNYPWDPFTRDPMDASDLNPGPISAGLDRVSPNSPPMRIGGAGLPVCYDPLWWYQVYTDSGGKVVPTLKTGEEYRFGSGIGLLRSEGANAPSAHGLQRITNFPFTINPSDVFASFDDIVMQSDGLSNASQGRGNPTVPDLSTGGLLRDLSYSWIFTGKQTDVGNDMVFDGDIVVFHNRPFATEQVPANPASGVTGAVNRAAGETVVEAIWGYGVPSASPAVFPYSLNDRSVLLRWPNSQPDPDVRVGGWIADVTYERRSKIENALYSEAITNNWSNMYSAQRCYWYRVAKKSEVTTDHEIQGYREMIVTVASPLRAKSPVMAGPSAIHINAAFVSPYVVNVVSKIFYSRL